MWKNFDIYGALYNQLLYLSTIIIVEILDWRVQSDKEKAQLFPD
nr:MAG TPA: hypothetical protein [Caudoviricetes sp.]